MSESKHLSPDEKITIGDDAKKLSNVALGVGIACLFGGVALGMGDQKKFFLSYIVAFMYVLTLGLGTLWFVAIQHLTGARWSAVVRRVPEILASNMWIIAVLALGLLIPMLVMHNPALLEIYKWLDHEQVHADHLLHHKAPYLNATFFAIRCVVYFGFWILLSRYYLKKSQEQDGSGDESISLKLRALSAPAMILFALTLTFCVIDFVMSINASWFSTMIGVCYFADCVLGGYSLIVLSLMWLQSKGRLATAVTTEHYHDLGKIMFAFTIFWAYVNFSQFMLIWYADIPEETFWYHNRFRGEWQVVSIFQLVGHFVIPFFFLMSRHIKRNRVTLAMGACWILFANYIDLVWYVQPDGGSSVSLTVVDLLLWVGLTAIFVGAGAKSAVGKNLIPTKDPRLSESLAFENI